MFDPVLAHLDITPMTAFLLALVEGFFRDYSFVVSFCDIPLYCSIIDFSLCSILWCMSFENDGGAVVFSVGQHKLKRMF